MSKSLMDLTDEDFANYKSFTEEEFREAFPYWQEMTPEEVSYAQEELCIRILTGSSLQDKCEDVLHTLRELEGDNILKEVLDN